ncbi:MAG: hypothetical protein ACE1ZA_20520, partial [Pseudomonadales bacterium]
MAGSRLENTAQNGRLASAGFTEGEISGHVIRLSGFMIMGFLAMTLAQLVEAVYLGIIGTNELAAIAFSFPVVMALNAATRGLGIGAISPDSRSHNTVYGRDGRFVYLAGLGSRLLTVA